MLGLPQKEGVRVDLLTASREALHRRRVDQMNSLADLTNDYVLATTILLFSHGGWVRDPVADYVRNYTGRSVLWMDLPAPLFEIHSDYPPYNGDSWEDWGRRLLACPYDEWRDLRRWLSDLGGVDFQRRRVHYVRPYMLQLPDVLNYRRSSDDKTRSVPVYTLALDGNWAGVYFESGQGLTPARVILRPPSKEAIAFAEAVLSTVSKPFAAMEAASSDQGMTHATPLLLPTSLRGQDHIYRGRG